MDPEKIGKFIYTLRKEKNLSQYQLAELIPISRQAVSKWERGKTTPDSLTLIKLSEIFNVTINELLNGERLLDNSIEGLQETTLHILDQSNKKSKRIKHNIIIFTTIIVILLLSFLSYYFINSYNSLKVYKVGIDDKLFNSNSGIFVSTKEKYYLKLGKIRPNKNLQIESIKLYYKNNNNYKLLLEDKDTDDLNIVGYYGYGEKFIINNIDDLIKNLYIDIHYDKNKVDTVKLRFRKDFTNTELFSKENRNGMKSQLTDKTKEKTDNIKEEIKDEKKEEQKEEAKKEEKPKETTQPTINENKENKNDNNKPQETPKQEPQIEEPEPQPVQEEVTPDLIINKIKEKGNNNNGTYVYSNNNNGITLETTYNSMMNQIITVKSNGDSWTYIGFINMFTCEQESDANLCKNKVIDDYNNYIK